MIKSNNENWTNAWLLLSVILIKNNATLESIIRQGDAIQHSIFTFDELNKALTHLISKDFIQCKNTKYYPSKKILNIFDKKSFHKKALIEMQKEIEIFLDTSKNKETTITTHFKKISIKEYNNACKAYTTNQ